MSRNGDWLFVQTVNTQCQPWQIHTLSPGTDAWDVFQMGGWRWDVAARQLRDKAAIRRWKKGKGKERFKNKTFELADWHLVCPQGIEYLPKRAGPAKKVVSRTELSPRERREKPPLELVPLFSELPPARQQSTDEHS